ncbi:glycosyltransferase family 2 protein [Nitrosospira multiformis]|uniref:Glycosyltransferase, GT2 family n=1 Tax=Nitrosospira multiformis TaxID=1231 RepID=A0A1I7I7L1_9PROT|nr:glycosyltransferase family 2 protein [Nitrosospira multiformis]SFU68963.1 Glycosyltransferase, GT2 family [Nitrosospira multiformis]
MKIAVVIVTWNSSRFLGDVLRALSCQTLHPDKVLIIDNGSKDADDVAEITKQYSFCELLCMRNNIGFASANNIAFERCSNFNYLALLNPDAFPESDWLEQLLTAAKAYPNIAAFGSRQLCHDDPAVLDGIGDSYHISGRVWRERHWERQRKDDLIVREIFSPCAAAVLYRRQFLIDIGGFDEDFFCYLEDVDLGFRLRLAGHKARYVPGAVVHHIGSATTGGQQSDFSVYYGHRNLVWAFVKNMPGILFWLLLPLHFLLNLATISVFISRGKGKVIWRAKKDAIKGIPVMWRKRRIIQAQRRASIIDIWHVLDKRLNCWRKINTLPANK